MFHKKVLFIFLVVITILAFPNATAFAASEEVQETVSVVQEAIVAFLVSAISLLVILFIYIARTLHDQAMKNQRLTLIIQYVEILYDAAVLQAGLNTAEDQFEWIMVRLQPFVADNAPALLPYLDKMNESVLKDLIYASIKRSKMFDGV